MVSDLKMHGAKLVLEGVEKLLEKYDCSSPEIKQFEKNLIDLTEDYLSSEAYQSLKKW